MKKEQVLKIRKDVTDDWMRYRRLILTIGLAWGFLLIVGKGICPLTNLFGLPCPGCGMTRSILLLLTGHFEQSWNIHPFAGVWIIFVITMGIERYVLQKNGKWKQAALILIAAGMLVFYIYRMGVFFPDREPMIYQEKNMMSRTLPGYKQWMEHMIEMLQRLCYHNSMVQ